MNQSEDLLTLPVFPMRNSVLFPFVLSPFSAGRPSSIAALDASLAREDKLVAVVAQRDATVEQPDRDTLYGLGTMAVVKRMVRSEETMEVILHGVERIELIDIEQTQPFLRARFRPVPVTLEKNAEAEALQRELIRLAAEYQSLAQPVQELDIRQIVAQIQEPMHLVYLLGTMLGLDLEKAQALLEASTQLQAMRLLHRYLLDERQIQQLRQEIAGQAASEMNRQQREYLLRQQLRAIQQELGEKNPEEAEVASLRGRLDEAKLPDPVRKEAEQELTRLERTPAASPEHQVARTHLELVLDLPWDETTEDKLDLARARQVLDEDHYDLQEIKERILEHLAVMKLNPTAKAPILCFVGPPGVGKTSLGVSIARALGRKFERFSLGGLHDEAELRGHRRTYIGAMPGRVIQAIRRAGVKNPLLMLDEIDKLGRDFRGDPASALLEILDPAQNYEFHDNYLDLPFDLSKVFFITTANTLDTIPGPLLDRMEILRLSGYSDEEKLEIARRYLLERQRRQAGLSAEQFALSDDTLLAVINRYTREAGVRELERMLGRLARKVALQIAEGGAPQAITPEMLPELLGPPRFFMEQARKELPPGVATGLAWTEAGGDVLYIEALLLPEGERLLLTGQLGNVMQESAKAAQSYIISHGQALGIAKPKAGVHIHVPAGAIPKDGPSAGVTMATAIASLYSGRPVRSDTAMTGEITLTGLVLPVGGIKEKVLAARRAGLRRVILPAQNEKDLGKLPESVRGEMEFVFAQRIEEVLRAAIPGLA
ncbi:MAG: endopeptidase La [Pseudomonadota bacterium]|uniref:endopeptidase La n=1 Tax=Thermithiobacillus tepidarius TaxID=929 RepID=UPI0003FC8D17|nr:endopeptidase La [Thermithiobacillus tepidarius]